MTRKGRKPVAMLDFNFEGMAVGSLQFGPPRRNGIYDYMPYRGPGHLEMLVALEKLGSARCRCGPPWEDVEFTVKESPEYGKLKIALDTSHIT
jgi:hypothetical protein